MRPCFGFERANHLVCRKSVGEVGLVDLDHDGELARRIAGKDLADGREGRTVSVVRGGVGVSDEDDPVCLA